MDKLTTAYTRLLEFKKPALKNRVATIETSMRGRNKSTLVAILAEHSVTLQLLQAALTLKSAASQIDNLLHALGILILLPKILEDEEAIIEVSLSAGTGGKSYDLETDRRVAEFKFINWQGGSNAVRHRAVFHDFVKLAESSTNRLKQIFLIDPQHSRKWLCGKTSLRSALTTHADTLDGLLAKYRDQVQTVSDYYKLYQGSVHLENILNYDETFRRLPDDEEQHEA